MRSLLLVSISLLGVRSAVATSPCKPSTPVKCNANDCARAVTGTRQGPVFMTRAREDCSSYVLSTVYGHSTTVTVASISAVTSKTIPTYATACSSIGAYVSACSCYGIPSGVVTNETSTTSTTSTTSSTSSTSSTSATSATPSTTGPGYQPAIPSSYAECDFDPSAAAPFDFLTPNALAIIYDPSGSSNKAVESRTDAGDFTPPALTFSHPPSAPAGVFDVVLGAGTAAPLYLAVYRSGAVGFVATSSNGQTYISAAGSPGASQYYITTIWSVGCDGLATAGILGSGSPFPFILRDNGDIAVSNPSSTRKSKSKRDIPIPSGFYVLPKIIPTPPGAKCPFDDQTAVTRTPPVPVVINGCGPQDWRQYFIPNLEFEQSCNGHDACWSSCSTTMESCNAAFLSGMYATCDAEHAPGRIRNGCRGLAEFYHSKVSGESGAKVYSASVAEFCECKCTEAAKKLCGSKCVDTKTDKDNCGSCGFTCPTGKCTNGACAFDSCAAQTCYNFDSCGAGGDCVCASIPDGTGFCVDGNTPCDGLLGCGTSADCGLGSVCAVGTCCERNVCITTDQCGGYNLLPARMFMPRGDWSNATVGHPRVYEG
ncbi:hypothetical protein B0T17DRAFT_584566 [Bombardia bombarda]|uniref:Uncharacterized protein n=1 Tax=Bombardia bombarda TaxID=252184 RepID=A0AA39WAJ2_9PEZI|nr:hypothetical protein B0T17DRAFT_584566 [Bombardia bombarda]